MLQEAFGAFAREQLRPAALDADAAAQAPDELLAQADELGLTMLGVPEELGGAVVRALGGHRRARRRVARPRRHGPRGRRARAVRRRVAR